MFGEGAESSPSNSEVMRNSIAGLTNLFHTTITPAPHPSVLLVALKTNAQGVEEFRYLGISESP